MLGIIGAMDAEVSAIKSKVNDKKTTSAAGTEFVCGTIENADVCVVQCSPGKVNAALCTQMMIDKFGVTRIINVGVGCSLSDEVVIKDVVIASDVCEYDIDVTALGEPKGFTNGLETVKIATDSALSDELVRAAQSCGKTTHRGTVASGDTFIASSTMKAALSEDFGAICGEMEGGAIGHVCAVNNVPFAVLRTISDGGNEEVQLDYPAFKIIAADISSSIIIKLLKKQKAQLSLNL